MDLSRLTLADKIIGATGLLLIIDLLFLPWHSIDLGPLGSFTRSGVESPNSFWGVLALLLTIAVLAVVAVARFANVKWPTLPVPLYQAVFFATIAVLVLLLIKLVAETDSLGFGAYLAILLGAGLVYGGFVKSREPAPELAAGGGGYQPPPGGGYQPPPPPPGAGYQPPPPPSGEGYQPPPPPPPS